MYVYIYMCVCKAIHAYVSQITVSQGAAEDFVCMYSMYAPVWILDPDADPDPHTTHIDLYIRVSISG